MSDKNRVVVPAIEGRPGKTPWTGSAVDYDAAYDDLMGLRDPIRGSKGLRSRCSRCNAPSVTNQKGYQRCEECWDDDAVVAEAQHGKDPRA